MSQLHIPSAFSSAVSHTRSSRAGREESPSPSMNEGPEKQGSSSPRVTQGGEEASCPGLPEPQTRSLAKLPTS